MAGRWPRYRSGVERVVFFSDAVFAIAITLLALDIRLPDGADVRTNRGTWHEIRELAPTVLTYLLSFAIIGMFWASHLRKFRSLAAYDRAFLRLDLLLLASIAFLPFPTSVIARSGTAAATILYAGSIVVVALVSAWAWWHAAYRARLLDPEPDDAERTAELVEPLVVAGVFGASMLVALASPGVARLSWLLLLAVALGSGSGWRRRRAGGAAGDR